MAVAGLSWVVQGQLMKDPGPVIADPVPFSPVGFRGCAVKRGAMGERWGARGFSSSRTRSTDLNVRPEETHALGEIQIRPWAFRNGKDNFCL